VGKQPTKRARARVRTMKHNRWQQEHEAELRRQERRLRWQQRRAEVTAEGAAEPEDPQGCACAVS